MSSWQWLVSVLHDWQGMGILLARLSVGLLFAISGGSKLFAPARRDEMRRTITAAGLPAPAMSAVLISSLEFIAGIFLVLGFLTPLCCLLLIGNMFGALGTTGDSRHEVVLGLGLARRILVFAGSALCRNFGLAAALRTGMAGFGSLDTAFLCPEEIIESRQNDTSLTTR